MCLPAMLWYALLTGPCTAALWGGFWWWRLHRAAAPADLGERRSVRVGLAWVVLIWGELVLLVGVAARC